MSQMLTYPGFSVVFIQTFSVHHTKEFILPEDALAQMNKEYKDFDEERGVSVEKADALKVPIAWVERDIENQIFVLPDKSPLEAPASAKKCLFWKKRRIPMKGNVRRYSLRGFDFTMPIVPAEDESIYEATLKGHCNVEMNLFFGHTVSITYRFLFDGHACTLSRPVTTDHIIAFQRDDAMALSLDDNTFDTVTATFGIRNFPDLEQGLREMCRVMRPQGQLCILELTTPKNIIARTLFKIYSHTILPLYGRLVAHDKKAYIYLTKTIDNFPQAETMMETLKKTGFHNPSFKRLTMGICTLYTATKQ